MKIRHLLVAGLLMGGTGIGTASASSVDTQDLTAPGHATVDVLAGHDAGGGSGSTAAAPAHDSSVPAHDNDGGSSAHPQVSARHSLGWQSLLPGSIQ